MPPPNNPNIAKVAMVFARDTRQLVNTFHVVNPIPWTSPAMLDLANLFASWWNTNYKTQSDDLVSLTQVQVRKYDPSDPLAVDLAITPPIGGTLAGTVGPANGALSVSWRTGLAGRKYRGRFYTVGVNEGSVDDLDRLISSYVSSMGAIAAQLLANVIAAGFSLAIFHRVDNTFTPVTQVIVENLLDSMRRRLPGRGR